MAMVTMKEGGIIIKDGECFVCGSKVNLTMHHTIPKQMNPKRNVIVPVCETCHDRINQNDVNSMVSFAFKLWRGTEELTAQAKELNRLVLAKKEREKNNDSKK